MYKMHIWHEIFGKNMNILEQSEIHTCNFSNQTSYTLTLLKMLTTQVFLLVHYYAG
jgi:hypothetical protein